MKRQISNGTTIVIPEICDYEVRRELLRANKMLKFAGFSKPVVYNRGSGWISKPRVAERREATRGEVVFEFEP